MKEITQSREQAWTLPPIGFGVYRLQTPAMMEEAIDAALEAGYRLFDTAQMYGNEALLANALRKAGVKRADIQLTTKIDPMHMEPKLLRASFMESLERLRSDYVDILLIHWPGQRKERLIACWEELSALKREGFVHTIGLSNAMIHHLQWLAGCKEKVMLNQIEINIYNQQRKLCDDCRQQGIALQAWAPLARGSFEQEIVQRLSSRYGCTPAQLVLAWNLSKGISVIPKSANPMRIKENMGALTLRLAPEDIAELDRLDRYQDMSHNPYTYDY